MGQVRAQITTRTGPAGTKDVVPVVQGDYRLTGSGPPREFLDTLGGCLTAARVAAGDGLVTEVAVLIYPDALAAQE